MTQVEKRVFDYIKSYIEIHGYAPTVREISAGIGMKSISAVHGHIRKLIELGELETDATPGTPRAIRIPGYTFLRKANTWIPADQPPGTGKYILLSFANFGIQLVGRYEEDDKGGAYYVGDDEESCISQDMIVNAWQPLPAPYRDDEED